ncbi:MAG: cytochrome C oxidase subunit IV family protein, partial [Acidobacteriales bacterium]|nr:cytochrome C oxidase subunit IV family protein [Terriglobales bacterium]
ATAHAHPTTRLFVSVWIGLVVITLIEVGLAYIHIFGPEMMLVLLLSLSIVKAGMIMSYFMHLRYERLSMVLLLIPVLVICISLMGIFFPDSMRALDLRVR